MNVRNGLLLVAALLVAVVTALWARSYLDEAARVRQPVAQDAPRPRPGVYVLVAAQDLPTGHFVQADDLRWQAWPAETVVDSYVLQGSGSVEDFVGAVVRSPMIPGEPITEGRLVRPGERGFLAAVLNPGMRAASVKIDVTSGVAGFIFPGDRVDVVLTHDIKVVGLHPTKKDKEVKRAASETVMHDVRVLAIDQATDNEDGQPIVAKTATLEVTPKQAEMLTLTATMGRLSLSLRSLARDEAKDGPEAVESAAGSNDSQVEDNVEGKGPLSDLLRRFYRNDDRTYTWDAEVSQLLKPPVASPEEDEVRVHIGRGSKAKVQAYRRGAGNHSRGFTEKPQDERSPEAGTGRQEDI